MPQTRTHAPESDPFRSNARERQRDREREIEREREGQRQQPQKKVDTVPFGALAGFGGRAFI